MAVTYEDGTVLSPHDESLRNIAKYAPFMITQEDCTQSIFESSSEVGSQTEDNACALCALCESSRTRNGVVQEASARSDTRTVARAHAEAERALRLLRHHLQLRGARSLQARHHPRVVACPAAALAKRDVVEADGGAAADVLAAATSHRAPVGAPRSESMSRRAGCVSCACPDLWGPREGNDPGLPDL